MGCKRKGVVEGKIAKTISELTGMTDAWVYNYLPQRFKEKGKVKLGRASVNRRLTEGEIVMGVEDAFQGVMEKVRQVVQETTESVVV